MLGLTKSLDKSPLLGICVGLTIVPSILTVLRRPNVTLNRYDTMDRIHASRVQSSYQSFSVGQRAYKKMHEFFWQDAISPTEKAL